MSLHAVKSSFNGACNFFFPFVFVLCKFSLCVPFLPQYFDANIKLQSSFTYALSFLSRAAIYIHGLKFDLRKIKKWKYRLASSSLSYVFYDRSYSSCDYYSFQCVSVCCRFRRVSRAHSSESLVLPLTCGRSVTKRWEVWEESRNFKLVGRIWGLQLCLDYCQ